MPSRTPRAAGVMVRPKLIFQGRMSSLSSDFDRGGVFATAAASSPPSGASPERADSP